jgi:hypothetical protein
MHLLMFGFQETNMLVWLGLTRQVMSFILYEYSSWQPPQVAMLLGAFSLGYVPLQIPYSLLARRTGQKALCVVNLLAQAAGCALLPAAARVGPAALSCVYALLGVFQGSRVPCIQVLERRWVPDGMERVRYQQLRSWGSQGVMLLHFTLIPLLARSPRIGWRFMPRWYAVQSLLMAALWQTCAADTPKEWRGPIVMTNEELQLLDHIGTAEEGAEEVKDSPGNGGAATAPAAATAHLSLPLRCPTSSSSASLVAGAVQQQHLSQLQPLSDKELPPLSMRQLFSVRKIQGMLAMCVVECTFPTFSKSQALWVLYFSERYELSVEQVLLRQTALIAPMSLGNALLQVGTAVRYEEGAPSHTVMHRRCAPACSIACFVSPCLLRLRIGNTIGGCLCGAGTGRDRARQAGLVDPRHPTL